MSLPPAGIHPRQQQLDKIVFFCSVLQHGSFREAAEAWGISAAAASRWVKELETLMAVELIKRSTRQLVPTDAGEVLYRRFSSLLPEIDTICAEVESMADEQRGVISISSTPLFAAYFLREIITEYMEMHPQVNFRLFIEAGEVDPLHVDFIIRAKATNRETEEKDSLLIRRLLLSEPLFACAAPSYLARCGIPTEPEALREHRCLYASSLVGGNRWYFCLDGVNRAVTISDALECDNSEILRDMAIRGAGVAYLPHSVVREALADGRLKVLLTDFVASQFDINLYFRPRHPMPTRCQAFKDYLLRRTQEIVNQRQRGSRA
ncbi:LysR family transcriptional regulator [Photobacterium sp. TY1-4]|uniref:LysR family transcriptional regulator n=1 Tax=Photobacterium sp. TY1-4 TaxID=2899122 RepID=UPI0021C1E545|nr:LysR family transcriptional regulator [Photobacterium sp. TY1-4]UXI02951.1 LysR family transcriptional regulator [Photobacterium sp. TY1-4]